MSKKIAITGGIGSGKSSLAKILAQRGYCVWDADIFSREVLFLPEVQSRIKTIFGDSAFISDGNLNREMIRNIIFENPKLKKDLEKILHPAMFDLFNSKMSIISKVSPSSWIFYEASLILELGRKSFFDFCIVVIADENIKIKRLNEKRNLSEEISKKIISSQMSDSEKITHADYVIDNSLSIQDLEESANKLLNYLTKNFKSQ
ncbi:dephospho-CoA kinase [Silvanigrella paludirubra]|uniref:Dephospho-CoA kinase n=1 Tax=Silvanigrella paludirubra TaxID=2499159 RepID=A0A6N6VUJ8_9BACT|nr:dephospho-CoA kinase [Silvanigrella paludirubra]KAB8038904.1 dephospho-CoA kinase [Silvanigrella paludirubra]